MNRHHPSETILDALCLRAAARPDTPAYHLLSDSGTEADVLTWSELDRRARALASRVAAESARGERVLLLYPSGLDYITALYACLYAGVVAVPAYPPRMNRSLDRILTIVEDCSPRLVLTDSTVKAGMGEKCPELQKLQWIATDTLDLDEVFDWTPAPAFGNDIAFLQYTSGSTASPKGVIVTHASLLRNLSLIGAGFGVDERSVIVSWLPMYHDMGLIGNVLATGWLGSQCYIMSPSGFVRRPAAWLRAISRFGATASGGPNFAYDLCVQKISEDECAGLDLSRWRTAFNGAEPIRTETMRRFTAKFQRYGFRPESFFPCYGLAESTLFVAGSQWGLPSHPCVNGPSSVSSGRPHVDRVVIVDPATRRECAPGAVGEIWVGDASVAGGYWNRPELSRQTFAARVASTNEGPFLRTGDLGVMEDDQLFVLGRLKDLIIVRGRNLYPHDIEATAEASTRALCSRGVVAFSVDQEGEERLVIVAEIAREHRLKWNSGSVGEAICRAVAQIHGVSPFEIVFVRPATTIRTSSGKLQRNATRDAYLRGALDVTGVWRNVLPVDDAPGRDCPSDAPSCLEELHGWLVALVSAKLNIPTSLLDAHRPIAEYGLDSLKGVELISAIEEKLRIELPFEALFVGDPSLSSLAKVLVRIFREHSAHPADEPARAVPSQFSLRLAMPGAQEAAL